MLMKRDPARSVSKGLWFNMPDDLSLERGTVTYRALLGGVSRFVLLKLFFHSIKIFLFCKKSPDKCRGFSLICSRGGVHSVNDWV